MKNIHIRKAFNILVVINMLILSLGLFSCGKGRCHEGEKAVFKDLTGLDGCQMEIELLNGDIIEPMNLDELSIEPEDGMKIWITYHIRTDMGSICQVGDIVEIDCISKR